HEGVRTDHDLQTGQRVSAYYDSMIAKVIAHGSTRQEARRRLTRALENTVLLGLPVNQSFLKQCINHPTFITGQATTQFIQQHLAELLAVSEYQKQKQLLVSAFILTLQSQRNIEKN